MKHTLKYSLLTLLISMVVIGCKKEKEAIVDNSDDTEEFFTGLEFLDKETYDEIPDVSLAIFFGDLPPSYYLNLPPPADQGGEGSCLAFALAYGIMGYHISGGFPEGSKFESINKNLVGSPEFLFNLIANDTCSSSKTVKPPFSNRKGGLDILKETGVCTWSSMPYSDINGCDLQPTEEQYKNANNFKIKKFEKVGTTWFAEQRLKSLIHRGFPILISVYVDEDFEQYKLAGSAWKKVDKKNSTGHSMVIMGYDDSKSAYKVLNSWGDGWGEGGYFWMDYSAATSAFNPLIQEAYIVYPDITIPDIAIPSLQTTAVSNIAKTTAQSGGNITKDGGASVTARGVVWSTTQNPTISNNKTSDGSGVGSFSSSMSNLQANTTYYVRAYATNSAGTAYGNQVQFKTESEAVVSLPTVQTNSVTDITINSAVSGGVVSDDGGANVTSRGVVWSTSQNPTISNSKTSNGTGLGSFSSDITGLQSNTTYYLRAYATNSKGTAYGTQTSFKTASGSTKNPYLNPNLTYGSITDIDGNKYATIQIGFQTWMAENLKVTRYNDGKAIPHIMDNSQWSNLTTGAYSIMNYSPENDIIYGKLYNWYAVNTGKLCPQGWRIPTENDWTQLGTYLGDYDALKMKSTGNSAEGTGLWAKFSIGYDGTNESGFTGLPGGYRQYNGTFYSMGSSSYWWSATQHSGDKAKDIYIWHQNKHTSAGAEYKEAGHSCRCVKD